MYGKIFEQIYDGTLSENWQALITFQQMIVLCDSDGFVDMTPQAISRRTGIPIEHIEAGLEFLEQEDPYSRTLGENGRRIIRIDEHRPWGWQIVNHRLYRDLACREDKKRADRDRIAAKRAAAKVANSRKVSQGVAGNREASQGVAGSREASQGVADVAHADADADADANTKNTLAETEVSTPPKPKPKPKEKIPYDEIVELYHALLPNNPAVRDVTNERKSKIRARWNKKYKTKDGVLSNSLKFWEIIFNYISESKFLTGRVDPEPGKSRFFADIDFIFRESSFLSIYEGKYHR